MRAARQKDAAAALVRELGFAFSINVVLHRANLDRLGDIIDSRRRSGPTVSSWRTRSTTAGRSRTERAHADAPQVARPQTIADEAIARYRGRMQIIYVLPDYYESYPKPCYGGWGRVYLVVVPDGRVLPCHGATHITTLTFDNVRDRSMGWIWKESSAFQAFRGDEWMSEPCRRCPRKAIDFGGCRCQAFALTGDATNTDPVCMLSPHHIVIEKARQDAPAAIQYQYRYLKLEPERA